MSRPLDFVAASTLALEMTVYMLVGALARHSPAVAHDLMREIDAMLSSGHLPIAGASTNLGAIRDTIHDALFPEGTGGGVQ